MRPLDVARMSLQALRRYPLRTAMMLLAIAIGVAAVVLLTAVGEGARRYVTGQFSSLGTRAPDRAAGPAPRRPAAGIQGLLVGETARELTLEDTIAIARSPRIRRVTPLVLGAGTASSARARARHHGARHGRRDARDPALASWAAGRFLPRRRSRRRATRFACSAATSRASCSPTRLAARRVAANRRRALPRARRARRAGARGRLQRRRDRRSCRSQTRSRSSTRRPCSAFSSKADGSRLGAAPRGATSSRSSRRATPAKRTSRSSRRTRWSSTFDTIFDMITAGLAGHRRDQPRRRRRADHERHARRGEPADGGDRLAEGRRRAQPADPRAVSDGGRVLVAARRGASASRSAPAAYGS